MSKVRVSSDPWVDEVLVCICQIYLWADHCLGFCLGKQLKFAFVS